MAERDEQLEITFWWQAGDAAQRVEDDLEGALEEQAAERAAAGGRARRAHRPRAWGRRRRTGPSAGS